uniref:urocortin n=1 Tax=Euleptes europaea TaxID=460621 RepID=UPI002540FFC2|nr:urocortin [Euleptes europaea]
MSRAPLPLLVASLLLLSGASLAAGRVPDLDGGSSGRERGLSLRLRLRLLSGEGRAPQRPPAAPGPEGAAPGVLRRRLPELSERLKRHEPPLSIDLTFHLLRQMLEISRAQSQQEQAEQNRLLFDALGK